LLRFSRNGGSGGIAVRVFKTFDHVSISRACGDPVFQKRCIGLPATASASYLRQNGMIERQGETGLHAVPQVVHPTTFPCHEHVKGHCGATPFAAIAVAQRDHGCEMPRTTESRWLWPKSPIRTLYLDKPGLSKS
jgi:hypothetical protein